VSDKGRWEKLIQCDSLEECRLLFESDPENTKPVQCDFGEECRSLFECDQELTRLEKQFYELNLLLKNPNQQIQEREERIRLIRNTLSWRVTKPLRRIYNIIEKLKTKN